MHELQTKEKNEFQFHLQRSTSTPIFIAPLKDAAPTNWWVMNS